MAKAEPARDELADVRRDAISAAKLEVGSRVLELACEERIGPQGQLVAFDHSPEMLASARALCREAGWSNVSFVQGDAAELELSTLGGEPFDAVVCVLRLRGAKL